MNVAVIGASDKPEKYSYQAVSLLREKGHQVFPVHPKLQSIDGLKVYATIKDVPQPIDTISLYVSADISSAMAAELISAKPRRLIFNPGAENPEVRKKADAAGIQTLEACTLVMLRTKQF